MDEIIKYMLTEDEGYGDITSNALINSDIVVEGFILSKDTGILAGINIIKEIFEGKMHCFI